jgi:hypothetical protein
MPASPRVTGPALEAGAPGAAYVGRFTFPSLAPARTQGIKIKDSASKQRALEMLKAEQAIQGMDLE